VATEKLRAKLGQTDGMLWGRNEHRLLLALLATSLGTLRESPLHPAWLSPMQRRVLIGVGANVILFVLVKADALDHWWGFPLFLALVATVLLLFRGDEQVKRMDAKLLLRPGRADEVMPRCAECGYDLRAATGGRCPECGGPIRLADVLAKHLAKFKPVGSTKGFAPHEAAGLTAAAWRAVPWQKTHLNQVEGLAGVAGAVAGGVACLSLFDGDAMWFLVPLFMGLAAVVVIALVGTVRLFIEAKRRRRQRGEVLDGFIDNDVATVCWLCGETLAGGVCRRCGAARAVAA
jgi:hypothetical protein